MSEMLNRDLGTVGYDNLVIRAGDVGHVELAAGQGILKRGSIINDDGKLYNGSADGKQPLYILCDDTETDDTEETTASVYKNGNYIRNSLIVATGYTLTDADVEELRKVNIIVETAE